MFYNILFILIQMTSSSTKTHKHVWTDEEDKELVQCLVQLVQREGWRVDNGTFRPGYMSQIYKLFKDKLLNTDIQSIQTLNTQGKNIEKQYSTIA